MNFKDYDKQAPKQILNNAGPKKLITGLVMLGLSIAFFKFFGTSPSVKSEIWFREVALPSVGLVGYSNLAFWLAFITIFTAGVMFIKGLFRTFTWNQHVDVFEGKDISGCKYGNGIGNAIGTASSSSVNDAHAYIGSKASLMTPDKAADLYINTSKLGSLNIDSGTMNYINSKMSTMSPEKQVSFLLGKK